METTHTPGPWRVHKPRKDIRTMFGGDTGIEILAELKNPDGSIGGYEIIVGHKNCQHNHRILDEANARLIAAAPDLLEALQELFEQCAMVHKHWGEGSNAREADAAIEAAKAAIAKATGR